VEQELFTLREYLSSPPVFSGVRVTNAIFSFMCMFCRSLFVLLYFFFCPLCCLFFFIIRIPITPLVSSSSSSNFRSSLSVFSKFTLEFDAFLYMVILNENRSISETNYRLFMKINMISAHRKRKVISLSKSSPDNNLCNSSSRKI